MIDTSDVFPADAVDLATQLLDTADAIRSRLEGLAIERAVVRRADWSRQAGATEGPKLRLLMEGAVTSAARSVVIETMIGTGADTGAWFGSTKAELDSAAAQLLSKHRLQSKLKDAAAAALAALNRP